MKHVAWIFMTISVGAASARQAPPSAEAREVRVYILDPGLGAAPFKDSAAAMTVATEGKKEGRTFLLPRREPDPAGAARSGDCGAIRGLTGTSYFLELEIVEPSTGTAAPAPEAEAPPDPGAAEGERKARFPQILAHARRGAFYSCRVPAELVAGSFRATITIRAGTVTFKSEEFEEPACPSDDPRGVIEDARREIGTFAEQIRSGHANAMRAGAARLERELGKLARPALEDPSRAAEIDRQWCLAMARALQDASYAADPERIGTLVTQITPRLDRLRTELVREEHAPESPPVK